MSNKKSEKNTKEKTTSDSKKETKKTKSKKRNNYKILYIVLVVIILIIILLVCGFFSKKDESKDINPTPIPTTGPTLDNNSTPEPKTNDTKPVVELKKHILKSDGIVTVTLNGKKITIKNKDGKLYYDDQYIVDAGTCPIEFEFVEKCSTLYETDQYVLISTDRDNKEYSHIINDKGKIIKIVKETAGDDVAGISDLVYVDGKLLATEYSAGSMRTVEFQYKNNEMHIVYAN